MLLHLKPLAFHLHFSAVLLVPLSVVKSPELFYFLLRVLLCLFLKSRLYNMCAFCVVVVAAAEGASVAITGCEQQTDAHPMFKAPFN
jgi:hypothetical protein